MSASENVKYWKGDLLGRKSDALLLHKFLSRRIMERQSLGKTGSYVLNLDASWGQGKSFFLQGFKHLLEAEGHVVVLVNAWEDDYAADPLLAVVSAIEKSFPKGKTKSAAKNLAIFAAKIAVTGIKHAAKAAVAKIAGRDGAEQLSIAGDLIKTGGVEAANHALDQSADAIGKILLKQFEENKAAVSEFRNRLKSFVARDDIQKPLFILIDELDRCRPNYAIALLERVKHLFEVDGIAFVIATDTDQLRHSISTVYGANFDGTGYLLRFFDRTYRFSPLEPETYIRKLFLESGIDDKIFSSPPEDDHVVFLNGMAKFFGLNLREIERCFDLLRSVATMWPPRPFKLQLIQLFPLVVLYCRNKSEQFAALSRCRLAPGDLTALEKARFRIAFLEQDGYGSLSKSPPQAVSSVILQFQKLAITPMEKIFDYKATDGLNRWCQQQFFDEFQRNRSGRRSEVRLYGRLIRQIAPLSDLSSQPGEHEVSVTDSVAEED